MKKNKIIIAIIMASVVAIIGIAACSDWLRFQLIRLTVNANLPAWFKALLWGWM